MPHGRELEMQGGAENAGLQVDGLNDIKTKKNSKRYDSNRKQISTRNVAWMVAIYHFKVLFEIHKVYSLCSNAKRSETFLQQ